MIERGFEITIHGEGEGNFACAYVLSFLEARRIVRHWRAAGCRATARPVDRSRDCSEYE